MDNFLKLFPHHLSQRYCIILYSWGIHDVVKTSKQVSFKVNGLKYSGSITLYQEGDKFYASFNETGTSCCDSTLNGLLDKIDSVIEVTEDYSKDVLSSLDLTDARSK